MSVEGIGHVALHAPQRQNALVAPGLAIGDLVERDACGDASMVFGRLLGGNGVNISAMQVGTTEEEGKNLMVLTVDNDIPAALLETVKALDGIFDAKLVNFYEI